MYALMRISKLLFVEGFRTQHWLFGCLAESTDTSAVALLSTHTPPPAPDAHYTHPYALFTLIDKTSWTAHIHTHIFAHTL